MNVDCLNGSLLLKEAIINGSIFTDDGVWCLTHWLIIICSAREVRNTRQNARNTLTHRYHLELLEHWVQTVQPAFFSIHGDGLLNLGYFSFRSVGQSAIAVVIYY